MKKPDMARFKEVVDEGVDWLVRRNQNRDGSFKDSLKIGCIFEMCQAIVSLLKYGTRERDQAALDGAVRCGEWVLKHQVRSHDRNVDGLWMTAEYGRDVVVVPDTIEGLWGLLELYRHTRDERYRRSSLRAFEAIRRARPRPGGIWVSGGRVNSRVYLEYNTRTRKHSGNLHRIIDDGLWYLFYRLTGDRRLLDEFKAQCDEQLQYQTPDGGFYETYFTEHTNAIMVAGARWSVYWATFPFFYAYEAFRERRYLDVIARSCRWLADRQEPDGSFYGWYYANGNVAWPHLDPNSPAVAIILWSRYMRLAGVSTYTEPCRKAQAWLTGPGAAIPPADRARSAGVGSAERKGIFNTRSLAFAIRSYYDVQELQQNR
jgi:uncharacterized protein YyaL (SSP411 family)